MRRYLTLRMLGAHALAVVCTGAAAGLGVWQYDAWQATRAAEAVDLTQGDPVPLLDVLGPDDPFPGDRVGQPVTLAGTWVPEGTVFVSGREYDGRDGFWVVTPLTTGGPDDPAVPVVRGWTDVPDDAPPSPSGPAEVQAILQPSEGTGAFDEDPLDDVFPQLRIADQVQRIDPDLFSAYAVLDSAAPGSNTGADGLAEASVEQLPAPGQFTALRNLLYAVEWWFFGAFALFIWWRFVTEEAESHTPQESDPAAPPRVSTIKT
ncbi:MAG: SURF1 family protein [Actinobacteria bacterium]|nr:SURF1 family protein [Actinomycetota bacterium]